jgi:hypothetical protein
MKQIFRLLLVLIILSIITIQGCIDQNNSGSKLVIVSLNTLGFKSNELPDNISKQYENFNETKISVEFPPNETVIFLEVYSVVYGMNEFHNFLTLDMIKLNSTDVAKEQFEREKSDLINSNYDIATDEKIGDDSIALNYSDQYIIIFRKYNVVSTIYPSAYDDLTIQDFLDYAKIIVNHIESSV